MNQLLVFGVVLGLTVSNPTAHAPSTYLDKTATSVVLDSVTDPKEDDGGAVTLIDPSTGSEVDSGKATPILM